MRDLLKGFGEFESSEGILKLTIAELSVLRLLRQTNIDVLTIHFREGKISKLDVQDSIPLREFSDNGDRVSLPNGSDFETVSFTKHKGNVVRATRNRPIPLTSTENEAELSTKIELLIKG